MILVGGMVKPSDWREMAQKLVWNIRWRDGNVKAIPVSGIKEFNILSIDNWARPSKEEWLNDMNYGRYYVEVAYTICTGCREIVFTADTETECREWIESIYEVSRC